MTRTVTLIPGDGIGPEVVAATLRVIEAAGAAIEWERHDAGVDALEQFGEPLPQSLLESIGRNAVALKGPVTTPVGKGFRSVNVQLRKHFELYANLRPVFTLDGIPSRYEGVDLVVVRENTEGLYSGLEHEVVPGVVESLKIITEKASTRIARFAFDSLGARAPAGHGGSQGQHHEAVRWPVPGVLLARSPKSTRTSSRRSHHRQHVHAAGAAPRGLTTCCLLENLYGDIVSDLAPAWWAAWASSRARTSARRWRLRGGARQRPGHRRPQSGQPHGADALGDPDAAPPGDASRRPSAPGSALRR